jgi:hypothetical protein
MKSKTFLLCRTKRLAVAARPISVATRLPHPCPVRPKRNRATPMALDIPPLHVYMDVDEPGLHMEMMDLDPWWEPFAEPSLQEEATACPCARDNEPEQKGSPPPVPVQPVRFDPPPTCVSNHRVLKPLPARRKVLANLSSPFNYSLPAVTTGASGGSNRGTGSKSSSSQQRVASQQSLPTASVKVESRKCKERSDQSQAQEKIPSPFGSPRPMELVPPPQEGLVCTHFTPNYQSSFMPFTHYLFSLDATRS